MGVQMGTNVQRKGLTGDNWNAHKGHNRIKRLCAAASLPACQPAGLSAGRSACLPARSSGRRADTALHTGAEYAHGCSVCTRVQRMQRHCSDSGRAGTRVRCTKTRTPRTGSGRWSS